MLTPVPLILSRGLSEAKAPYRRTSMFTGIITDIGTVRKLEQKGDLRLTIGCN